MIPPEVPRDELIARLEALLAEAAVDKHERERLVHDLQVHQLELELQNRELREAQGALEESRARYADLYDFAPIAYFTFDRHGRVEEVNLSGATMIGRERVHVLGLPFVALVKLADPALFWAHLRRCEEARAPVVTEFALVGPRVMYLRAAASPVVDRDGRIVAFRTAFIDITDRRAAELARNAALASEQELRRSLERLDRAKTALTRALATELDRTAVLLRVVDQARSLADAELAALGVGGEPGAAFDTWTQVGLAPQPAEAIGLPPRVVATLAAVVTSPAAVRVKDLSTHPAFVGLPDHHPPLTSFLGVPIAFGDRRLGTLYLANKRGGDEFTLDDQQAVEALTRHVGMTMEIARLRDQAQAAIRARDSLLAVVSHDLRSPLSAISVSANVLLRRLTGADTVTQRRQVETILRATGRMTRFTNDLLTASALEVGQLVIATHREPIGPILREAVDELTATLDESAQLRASIPADLPDVTCDRDRVHQVVANLLGNAAKFSPEGTITLEAARRGDEVQVSVTDTGPGICEDDLPRVFHAYWKAPSADQRGVGLGLYICHGIIEGHGGRIWVERSSPEGTRFTFSLPIAPPSNPG